jgi:hypothetical protein
LTTTFRKPRRLIGSRENLFRLLVDPNDFMVPQVFNPSDDRWRKEHEWHGRSHHHNPDPCR